MLFRQWLSATGQAGVSYTRRIVRKTTMDCFQRDTTIYSRRPILVMGEKDLDGLSPVTRCLRGGGGGSDRHRWWLGSRLSLLQDTLPTRSPTRIICSFGFLWSGENVLLLISAARGPGAIKSWRSLIWEPDAVVSCRVSVESARKYLDDCALKSHAPHGTHPSPVPPCPETVDAVFLMRRSTGLKPQALATGGFKLSDAPVYCTRYGVRVVPKVVSAPGGGCTWRGWPLGHVCSLSSSRRCCPRESCMPESKEISDESLFQSGRWW